jgi:hypothetical protein
MIFSIKYSVLLADHRQVNFHIRGFHVTTPISSEINGFHRVFTSRFYDKSSGESLNVSPEPSPVRISLKESCHKNPGNPPLFHIIKAP